MTEKYKNVWYLAVVLGLFVGVAMINDSRLRAAASTTMEECSQYGECEWCSSGSPCYVESGDPGACDQWDGTGEDCDWSGAFCGGTTGPSGVVCDCLPCA